jgi:hypothetical protein
MLSFKTCNCCYLCSCVCVCVCVCVWLSWTYLNFDRVTVDLVVDRSGRVTVDLVVHRSGRVTVDLVVHRSGRVTVDLVVHKSGRVTVDLVVQSGRVAMASVLHQYDTLDAQESKQAAQWLALGGL